MPLLAYESCNLGSINVAHFVADGTDEHEVDWPRLGDVVQQAVRFLDDVLVVNRYPLPDVEAMTIANRKIGLGVMGFAELLIRLGIPYSEEQATVFARQMMGFIAQEARRGSAMLAAERGVFPSWSSSIYASQGTELRNATTTSIAPTGTISIIAGTSSGIEPLFALSYRRVGVLDGQTLVEFNPSLVAFGERLGFLPPEVLDYVRHHGTLSGAPDVPERMQLLFATALEVAPRQHLAIQAAFQSAVDNAVSKTINLPAQASPKMIAEIYCEAYRLGLKGITVFRYGSIADHVLQLGIGEEPFEREHAAKCDPYQCRL